jgi:hypothetical protein
MKVHRSALSMALAAVLVSQGASAADSTTKAECSAAYEKAQEQRSDGHLKAAKATLSVCARDACPSFVRSECSAWLGEIAHDLPSIVVDAKDSTGNAPADVVVTIDGTPYAPGLDGKPIELDPGEHTLRFELEGATPIEKREFLEKGSGAKKLRLTFESTALAPVEAPPTEDAAPEPASKTNLRPYAYIAGGVGAAGLIGFAVFGAMGKGKQSDLESTCSPNCTQDEIDSVKSKFLIADISLGVGIVGLGTGVALFLLSQPSKSEPPQDAKALKFDLKTSASSAYATVSGSF